MSCLFYEWISDGSSEETDNDGSVLSNETTSTVSLPIIYPVIIRGPFTMSWVKLMGKWRVKWMNEWSLTVGIWALWRYWRWCDSIESWKVSCWVDHRHNWDVIYPRWRFRIRKATRKVQIGSNSVVFRWWWWWRTHLGVDWAESGGGPYRSTETKPPRA